MPGTIEEEIRPGHPQAAVGGMASKHRTEKAIIPVTPKWRQEADPCDLSLGQGEAKPAFVDVTGSSPGCGESASWMNPQTPNLLARRL